MFQSLINVAAKRLAGAVPTVLLLSMVVFFVLRALPADPLALLLPPNAPPADAEAVRKALGLDRSIVVQYLIWLRDALSGDLGNSIAYREPVTRLLANSLPATLELSFVGLTFALLISVPGGLDEHGLPLGLQLIGRPFDEETLFSTAEVIEQAAGRMKLPDPWW